MDTASVLTNSSHLHELVFSDRHYINKLQQLCDFILYLDKISARPLQNIFMLIRPRGFGLSLATEAIESFLMRDELLIDHIEKLVTENYSLQSLPDSPVIRLSFDAARTTSRLEEFSDALYETLQAQLWEHHVKLKHSVTLDHRGYLLHLIRELSAREGKPVVIIIDGYDIPLLASRLFREGECEDAQTLYFDMLNAIRQAGDCVKFCLLTGHLKFALSSSLSEGLPHIIDLSYHDICATLLGFTLDEVKTCYEEEIQRIAPQHGVTVAEYLDALDHCYGGFVFSDNKIPVLNPSSITKALDHDGELYAYACDGNYSFLQECFEKEDPDLSWMLKDGQDAIFLDEISLHPQGKEFGSALLQLGFISIDTVTPGVSEFSLSWRYRFKLTNVEMRRALNIIRGTAQPELRDLPINTRVYDADEYLYDIDLQQ